MRFKEANPLPKDSDPSLAMSCASSETVISTYYIVDVI